MVIANAEAKEIILGKTAEIGPNKMKPANPITTRSQIAILREENRKNILRADFVIYLKASPKVLWSRLQEDRTRPLLQVDNPLTRLEKLYAERHPLYESLANLTVDGDTFDSSLAVRFIMKELENANS